MPYLKQLGRSLTDKERTKDVILDQQVAFSSLILPQELTKGLAASGYNYLSPIQLRALPLGRCGLDLIVKSKSGTGKTLVFSIIALESLRLEKCVPQVLILAPTREIAFQIQEVIRNISANYEGVQVECFIGGLPVETDKINCKKCHIAIGTPGRVKQLIKCKNLIVANIKLFILDEADKLIEESFLNDINEIYNELPENKQIIMSSATYPENVRNILSKYMRNPALATEELETPILLGLKQYVRLVEYATNSTLQCKIKNEELLKILSKVSFTQCVIFVNFQVKLGTVCNFLNSNKWNAVSMSGELKQTERLNVLKELKNFKHKILVSTDLTSRGIDVPNVDLVINYDIPQNASTYLHRMGRAGRYGSPGFCINLASMGDESQYLQNILGIIGGNNFSMPILDEEYDLNVKDYKKETCLFGTVSDCTISDIHVVRNKLKEITNTGEKPKKNSKVKVKNTNSLDAKVANNEHEEKLEIDKESAQKTETILQQLIEKNRISSEVSNSIEEKDILTKNKALLSAAKLLNDVDLSDDDLEDVSNFLKKEIKQESKQENTEQENDADVEEIFSLAFDSRISSKVKNWYEILGGNKKLNKTNSDDNDDLLVEDAEECRDDDYNFDIEKEIEINYSNEPNVMEWVPVEPSVPRNTSIEKCTNYKTTISPQLNRFPNDKKVSVNYLEKYRPYFDQCSSNLWQNGLSFDTVANFDEWFSQNWEMEISAIRDFVQGKIYYEEMSKFN